jgi:adenosylcobinamide kinase / adenosylcobinamide-phosphate guanylyltransferase
MNKRNRITLLIGGARSGKSAYAQELAGQQGGPVLFCATAEALDDEMAARIEVHKSSRPATWDTLEANIDVGERLRQQASRYDAVIIDCITVLVANAIGNGDAMEDPKRAICEIDKLVRCLKARQANFILVSNDVGSGLIPENKLGRIYRDCLGQANQKLAACADEVYLLVAGLPVKIK